MMIGLPTETWEDVEEIVHFAEKIRAIGRPFGPSCKVNVSVGAFVPKSHTPFQWDAFEDLDSLREKIEMLRRRVPNRWSRLKWHEADVGQIEAVLSRGDRRLARAIHRVWELGGRYDGWTEHFSHARWLRALDETGLSVEMYTRRFDFDEVLPWDHIDIGILKKFLLRERKKTDELSATPDCRHGECAACGIPGMPDDTRLTPALDEEASRALRERASSGSGRRSDAGMLWPVRVRFAKEGPARFLSHLETGSILQRTFRMAEVPVGHSQGHSPHPKFHFGPPLPVGVAGTSELFDVELEQPWRRDHLDRLNEVLPGGFRIVDARALPSVQGTRRKSLSAEAVLGVYQVDLSRLGPERGARIATDLARFLAASEWIVRKVRGGSPDSPAPRDWEQIKDRHDLAEAGAEERTIDLKQACTSLSWEPASMRLGMTLRILDPAGNTANPARIFSGILDLGPEEQARCFAKRTAILKLDGSPI